MPKRLIVVADQSIAHFYRAMGRKIHQLIHTIPNLIQENRAPNDRHMGFSQPRSVTGHFFDPHMHQKNLEKEHFARQVTDMIYKASADEKVDELILVAEPKMLGFIRQDLDRAGHRAPPVHKCLSLSATALTEQELEDKIFS